MIAILSVIEASCFMCFENRTPAIPVGMVSYSPLISLGASGLGSKVS